MGTNKRGGGGSNEGRPASQQRGQATGKHIPGDPEKGRAKLDKMLEDWKDDIENGK